MTGTRMYHDRNNLQCRRGTTTRTWVQRRRPFSIVLMVSLAVVVLLLARSTTAWNVGHGGSSGYSRHRAPTFARVEVAPLHRQQQQQQRCNPSPRKQLPEDLVSSALLMSQEQYHDDDFDNDERDLNESESSSSSSINSDTTINQEVSLNNSNNGKPGKEKEEKNITAVVERKLRVAAAQEKIDRILNGPDPPFDMEHEMKRVVQIAPSDGGRNDDDDDDSGDEELEQEAKVSRLEKDLYDAVKHQDYERAASAKRELDRGHLDNCGAVLQANAAFYRAFSHKDYDAMESLWLHDATSTCIHPTPAGPLIGSKSVLGAWKRMFASRDYSFQRNWMEPADIRLSMKGACTAVITCTERVYARRFVRGRKRQTELLNLLLATNVFRKVRGKWHLTHHHSSWHPDSDLAHRVREIQQQQQQQTSNSIVNRGIGGKGRAHSGMVQPPSSMLDRYNLPRSNMNIINNNNNSNNNRDEEEDDINAKIGMDGILGTNNFEPLLGDDDKKNKSEGGNKQQPIKVVGSLSDLLSGGLGDLLGGAAGAAGNGAADAGGGSAIIRFSSQMDDGPTQEDDDEVTDAIADAFSAIENASDDDDDNDGDDDGDDSDDGRNEAIMIKQWTPSMDSASSSKQGGTSASSSPSSSSSSSGSGNNIDNKGSGAASSSSSSSPPKDALLRQNCISALRKLCNEGCISPNQKRVLLTDIITCSAKGEFSMVEVAYELLLTGEGDGEAASSSSSPSQDATAAAKNTAAAADIAEEEFADQCRVFAHSLLQESSEAAAASTR